MKDYRFFFLVPGLSEKYSSGGLLVTKDVVALIKKNANVDVGFISTHEKNPDSLPASELFKKNIDLSAAVFVVTWGPLVAEHIKLLRRKLPDAKIIYFSQSFGWGARLPANVPIGCVSRYVMANWALYAPNNFIFYAPPPLREVFSFKNSVRDIDILVHTRKQNEYCLKKLVPAIEKEKIKIEAVNGWISQEDFSEKLNRTKLFLYITALHKASFWRRLPGEGFGLPALEAVACGAMVGSNLLGGVTDFLTPGENCLKLENANLDFDVRQILQAIKNFTPNEKSAQAAAAQYSSDTIWQHWNKFFQTFLQ